MNKLTYTFKLSFIVYQENVLCRSRYHLVSEIQSEVHGKKNNCFNLININIVCIGKHFIYCVFGCEEESK